MQETAVILRNTSKVPKLNHLTHYHRKDLPAPFSPLLSSNRYKHWSGSPLLPFAMSRFYCLLHQGYVKLMLADSMLLARRDVTTSLRLNTKNRFKPKTWPWWLTKVAPNHCSQPRAISSAGVTPPVPERTHTQRVVHVTFSCPLSPWVTSHRCVTATPTQSQSYVLPATCRHGIAKSRIWWPSIRPYQLPESH